MSWTRLAGLAFLLALASGAASGRASTPSPIVFAADRAPTVTGEVYRLDPSGHRVDLSKSLYQDIDPAASPDGKHVAFFSDRGGRAHAYEVDIDGRGLHKVGPSLQAPVGECNPRVAWQPGSTHFVVNACTSGSSKLWIVGSRGKAVAVRGGGVLVTASSGAVAGARMPARSRSAETDRRKSGGTSRARTGRFECPE